MGSRPVKNQDVFKYSFLPLLRSIVSGIFGGFLGGVGDLVLLLFFAVVLLFFF